MAFYDQQAQHSRQQSWETSHLPSRSGAASSAQLEEDSGAFRQQFEEIERAHENLAKSSPSLMMHGRRKSLPPLAGQFAHQLPHGADTFARPDPNTWDSRQADRGGVSRHHTINEYDGLQRSSSTSSSVQGYLQSQRFGPPRPNEAESMLQAKRRAAAARERELRNYHMQQQYNRGPGSKGERAMSPSAMNEEDRRELLSRQHRALYGDNASLYDAQSRAASQDSRNISSGALGSGHGSSPLGFDSFRQSSGSATEGGAQMADQGAQGSRSRADSASGNPTPFAMFENAHSRTSASSPGDAVTGQQVSVSSAGHVGPIGSRPAPALTQAKRGTPPMPSPLGFVLSSGERSAPLTSTAPSSGTEKSTSGLGWPSSGPWGPTHKGQSVWG